MTTVVTCKHDTQYTLCEVIMHFVHHWPCEQSKVDMTLDPRSSITKVHVGEAMPEYPNTHEGLGNLTFSVTICDQILTSWSCCRISCCQGFLMPHPDSGF